MKGWDTAGCRGHRKGRRKFRREEYRQPRCVGLQVRLLTAGQLWRLQLWGDLRASPQALLSLVLPSKLWSGSWKYEQVPKTEPFPSEDLTVFV